MLEFKDSLIIMMVFTMKYKDISKLMKDTTSTVQIINDRNDKYCRNSINTSINTLNIKIFMPPRCKIHLGAL